MIEIRSNDADGVRYADQHNSVWVDGVYRGWVQAFDGRFETNWRFDVDRIDGWAHHFGYFGQPHIFNDPEVAMAHVLSQTAPEAPQ